jgi:hypothetical protein
VLPTQVLAAQAQFLVQGPLPLHTQVPPLNFRKSPSAQVGNMGIREGDLQLFPFSSQYTVAPTAPSTSSFNIWFPVLGFTVPMPTLPVSRIVITSDIPEVNTVYPAPAAPRR